MITLFTLLLCCSPAALPQEVNEPSLSAVKVFSTKRNPELDRPWTKEAPQEGTGSGVILDGGFLLTNAHVVSYAQRVEVQPNGSGKRHEVEVAYISKRDDLALLRPIEEDFFDLYPSVPLAATLPELGR